MRTSIWFSLAAVIMLAVFSGCSAPRCGLCSNDCSDECSGEHPEIECENDHGCCTHVGCCCCKELMYKNRCGDPCAYRPMPIGTISDAIWQRQETNAEASDFVIHEHEFIGNTARLNKAGEDHLKQIAARVVETPFPVIIEPSSMSKRYGDKYGYPVHGHDGLDLKRREVVVAALASMGIHDADQRTVIAPALTPGFEFFEAERAYNRGFNGRSGAGFGGFGGLGGFGGFGFGGF